MAHVAGGYPLEKTNYLAGMRKRMTELKGKTKTRAAAENEGSMGTINPLKAPPSDSSTVNLEAAASCPVEAWRKILTFLSLREVTQAALAFSSGSVARDSIGNAWDPHTVLCGLWPGGAAGFQPFLVAAHATQLAEHVFYMAPRKLDCEEVKALNQRCTPNAATTACRTKPRSMMVDKSPSSLAFSNGKTLLAIAAGKEIKLIRRNDLKSCGNLILSKGKAVGSMTFSPDNSTLAIIPATDSGVLSPEIQFYSTEEKSKPVVTTLKAARLSSVDFLRGPGAADLVAACDFELCKISPSTGDIIASWTSDKISGAFTMCQVVSPHEVITLADRSVNIWDLRTSDGLARSVKAPQPITALDSHAVHGSSMTFLGDSNGALHRLDWRGTSASGPELLWSPPKCLGSSLPSHKVMVEQGCVCLITGPLLTMLAINPCVIELGWADATRLSAAASGCGAWAFATNSPSAKTVFLVESGGEAHRHQIRKDKEFLVAATKNAESKAERKRDTNGKNGRKELGKAQHAGKASSGRCARTHPGSCRF
eukprot:gnl/MRDRNA2_/MRDRNA2_92426_c0_seq1.p1 gnl/MRDRNA2_/MRDRNA2_92426_c0~~gnl/MRDRNA2_/MRDRNA2_92426_c0_seq1.p1  ORF type:complete len:538 (+),score=113.60 gnl/MRDRNA2_/MRDRNA2_92426_c0_seq1:57-1670(+)